MIGVSWGTATDVGRVRAVNEDALLAQPPVFLVADGMGGHAAGDVASAIVVEEFSTVMPDQVVTSGWILERFDRADLRIREGQGGGTTVAGVALIEQDGRPYWLIFNIGDSRVYHGQGGRIIQKSVDHSVVQELIESGDITSEGARFHPQRHVITRAVGLAAGPEPDFWLLPAAAGDRLMMCSDGLTSEIDDVEIARLAGGEAEPCTIAQNLVDAAVDAGGRDNVTVVVVDLGDTASVSGRHHAADPGSVDADERTQPRRPAPEAVIGS
ncbi:serine/threonine-protein phosphatase [Nakamurella silvestris]|nr:serine/threonine-protein phosphatase [Nakamurella silvestris]